MEERKTITRLENKNMPEKDLHTEETEEIEAVMMFWKKSEGSLVEEPDKETDDQEGTADEEMQKQKGEEAHVNSTLHDTILPVVSLFLLRSVNSTMRTSQ